MPQQHFSCQIGGEGNRGQGLTVAVFLGVLIVFLDLADRLSQTPAVVAMGVARSVDGKRWTERILLPEPTPGQSHPLVDTPGYEHHHDLIEWVQT